MVDELDGRYSGSYQLHDAAPDTDYGIPETILCELDFQDEIICLIDREQEKSAMVSKNLELFKGNNKQYVCYVKDRQLQPIDISNGVCYFTAKEDRSDPTPVIEKSTNVPGEGQIGAANKGEFYFYLVPADTSSLEQNQYFFDVTVVLSSGKLYTVAQGMLYVKDPIR